MGPLMIAKGAAELAVVRRSRRLTTKIRVNQRARQLQTNSMPAMLKTNSQPVSLVLRSSGAVDTLAADALSVAKLENGFRRSYRALVLARVVKSKSGFARDESLSTARLRFSAFALVRQITYASMDA